MVVEGEGGIGKTRLIEEIAREAGASGIETYVGRAEELERARPLGALAHALRGLGRDVRDLLWGTVGSNAGAPSVGETRIVELVLDLLEERAIRRPVLICVEDLHWADAATLLFMRAATRRIEGLPLGVIATCRPPQDFPDLAQLIDRVVADGHPLVRLGPLDGHDVELLVRDAVGDAPGPLLLAEVARASGSPFYILEFLSALEEEGAIVVEGDRAELRQTVLPPTLRLTILRRLAALPAPTLDALRLASIIGSSFAMDDLALLERKDVLDLYAVLDPAIRSGFVTDRDERLGFRHDLVRSALYEDMPESMRKTLHRKLADAMGAAGRPITTVATHMSLGAEANDLEAAAWLILTTYVLGNTQLATSVEFGRRAIEIAPSDAAIVDDYLPWRVMGLALTRRSTEAEKLARDLLGRKLEPTQRALVRQALAQAMSNLGRAGEANEQYELLLADDGLPGGFRAVVVAEMAGLSFGARELDRAVSFATEAIAAWTTSDTAFAVCSAHMALSYVASARGCVADAVRHGEEAARAADVAANTGTPHARVPVGLALMDADKADRAVAELRFGLKRLSDAGASNDVLYMRALAFVRWVRGEWDDALAEAAASVAQGGDERLAGHMTAYAIPLLIQLLRGEASAAEASLTEGEIALATSGDRTGADLFLWAKAKSLESEGNARDAFDTLTLVWSGTEKIRYLFGSWRLIWPDLARLAAANGQQDLATEVAAAADEGARLAGGIASANGAALRTRGLADHDPDALARASEIYEVTPRPVERAMVADDAGVALAEHGETDRAVPLLTRAFDLYDALGATRETDRINAVLRGLGVHHGRRGARKRPTSGWEALTPTELRVASLVGDGLTNRRIGDRLFISPRTVQTHMRSVFDKLGASSRAEVVAETLRRSSERGSQRTGA